jgi:hypothetical protein
MTTTIFTNLIGPICELYYKSLASQNIQQQTIDSFRNYRGNNVLNFGFEIQEPITNVFTPTLQLGVFTSNYLLKYQSSVLLNSNITMPEVSGISTVQYINKTLPIVISLSIADSVIGFTTASLTNGYTYTTNSNTDQNIIRNFETTYALNTSNCILYFIDFVNAYVTLQSGILTLDPKSTFKYRVVSLRSTSGIGAFNSYSANQNFTSRATSQDTKSTNSTYEVAYGSVYNWKNNLTWPSGFSTWYSINSSSINVFIQKFLHDYFGF